MSGTIIRCFLDSDLRSGHLGLTNQARKEKVFTNELGAGEYVVFINRKRDRVKVYTGNEVIAYMKAPRGTQIDLRVIEQIPKAFLSRGSLSYDRALEKVLSERVLQ